MSDVRPLWHYRVGEDYEGMARAWDAEEAAEAAAASCWADSAGECGSSLVVLVWRDDEPVQTCRVLGEAEMNWYCEG